jgi:uncharacterized protein (TIRG00374 family)
VNWFILIKLAVTIAAFIILARYVDPWSILSQLADLRFAYVGPAVVLGLLQVLLVALRWRLVVDEISRPEDAIPSTLKFYQIAFLAQFFGQFMPFLASDGIRVLYLHDAGCSLATAFKGTLIDRGIALLVLLAFVPLSRALWPFMDASVQAVSWLLPMSLVALLAAAVALLTAEQVVRLFSRWPKIARLAEVLLDMRRLAKRPLQTMIVLGLCASVHGLSIGIFWLLAAGQGIAVDIVGLLNVVPLILIASTLPIAIAGWGVREGASVVMFALIGVPKESALLLSVAFGSIMLAAALPGALMLPLTFRRGRLQTGTPKVK